MQKRLFFLVAMLLTLSLTVMAQITTSSLAGKVTINSEGGEEVIGATVQVVHVPSGTRYAAVTNTTGRYTIQGMRAGGPYEVTVSYIGYETKTLQGINLLLGETYNLNVWLEENANELGEVVVMGRAGLDATKTGAAQSLSANEIGRIPSLTHGIADVARLNPQLNISDAGAMSFAGINNRYNSFQIDGAMNNDVFGLTSNGSNGGQAGTQPVSMETIEQIQINIAPFDVRQSGFTGGAINAITKSGTNEFHGSLYGYGYNENLISRRYRTQSGKLSEPYQDEKDYQIGVTLGGPIIKNKLFFFVNYEKAKKSYPNNFGLGAEGSNIDGNLATQILDEIKRMAREQGIEYNGAFTAPDNETQSDKAGVKLDWNINDNNKFSIRWSLVDAKQLNQTGSQTYLNADTYSYFFRSKTNTFIAELQSRISPTLSNEARVSYVRVRDKRDPSQPFPMIQISNAQKVDGRGYATIEIGNERSSMANGLDQDIWTLEDNLTWFKGNHTITLGTHNELYKFSNIFLQDLYGTYYYANPEDFFSGKINQYRYGHADTNVTGDARWAAEFSAGQLGFYLQDKWDITNNFQLTYGLRADIPLFFDTPVENAPFNTYAASKGWGVKTNHKLSSSPMWSPRVGFRWDITGDRRFILRGGAGIFTGRIPFVWLSNNFSNTGIQLKTYNVSGNGVPADLRLILDPNGQTPNEQLLSAGGSQTINVFEDKFKFSQNLRANLGLDFQFLGISWTAEAIYSKTLNDIYYQNLAYDLNGKTLGGEVPSLSFDNRPLFSRVTTGEPYAYIYELKNTNKGYTYNLSLQAKKSFDFGLDLMASYTFTRSRAICNGTSSVAQSNWAYNYTHANSNDPEMGFSAFNIPHHIKVSAFYNTSYGANKAWQTTVGLIYDGSTGTPYSLYYYGDLNGDSSNGNDLLFIPTEAQLNQMEFIATKEYSEADQRRNMNEWIENDPYMSKHRGEYFERYAANLPFEHHFDVHLAEKFSFKVGKQVNSIELSFDILNVANLLDSDWGHTYGNGFGSYANPVTYNASQNKFQFTHPGDYNTFSYSDFYSRWRGQLGLKYTF